MIVMYRSGLFVRAHTSDVGIPQLPGLRYSSHFRDNATELLVFVDLPHGRKALVGYGPVIHPTYPVMLDAMRPWLN